MYSLYAILGRTDELEPKPRSFDAARCVRLGAALSMVPLSETLIGEIQATSGSGGPREAEAFEFLTPGVEAWARALSVDCEVAYVETEYVAGEGFERAGVWSHGKLVLGPLEGAGSINQALRALGVRSAAGIEEFELVGLSRHRCLDDWLHDERGAESWHTGPIH